MSVSTNLGRSFIESKIIWQGQRKSSQNVGEAKSDEHDKEAIGTLSCRPKDRYLFDYWKTKCVFDLFTLRCKTTLQGSWTMTGALMVTHKTCSLITPRLLTPGTYNLQDIIDKSERRRNIGSSIRSLSQDKLIQLTNEKKTADSFDKRQAPSTKLFLAVVGSDATDGIPSPMNGWSMKISWSDNDYPRNFWNHTDVLSWNANNKELQAGGDANTLLCRQHWIREIVKTIRSYI